MFEVVREGDHYVLYIDDVPFGKFSSIEEASQEIDKMKGQKKNE